MTRSTSPVTQLAKYVSLLGAAISLAGCVTLKDAPNLTQLDVNFDWKPANRCSAVSPEFRITGIPADTKTLKFSMVDLNVPTFMHGGGNVPYLGGTTIKEGSFTYVGPCPPAGNQHRYEFTVQALNAAGDTVLARGKAVRVFP
jgi:phosphatidylethanolamine-binding protein (PEBP) family uncharacterized protein